MTNWQKIFIGMVALGTWLLALYVHHHSRDIDTSMLSGLALQVLTGLGVQHINDNRASAAGSGSS